MFFQQTSSVASQSQQPGLPIVCIKMTSVIGVSWILGYFALFQSTAFLWYPYVVLNSLQGQFAEYMRDLRGLGWSLIDGSTTASILLALNIKELD